jgi:hypothetical protein
MCSMTCCAGEGAADATAGEVASGFVSVGRSSETFESFFRPPPIFK